LPKPDTGKVEWAALQHLATDDAPVFYVENTLINALFGLLCWPVIFQPLPGAFFHPFHIGPADLTREDFVARRQQAFEQRFHLLDTGADRREILVSFNNKKGIDDPVVFWAVRDEALLDLALHCIPSAQLDALFRRLLHIIQEH